MEGRFDIIFLESGRKFYFRAMGWSFGVMENGMEWKGAFSRIICIRLTS